MPTAYEIARVRARIAEGRLTAVELREINSAISRFSSQIERRIREGGLGVRGLEQTARIVQRQGRLLGSLLERTISTGRSASFREVRRIWRVAGSDFARARGVTPEELAQIRTPSVSMLGAFELISPAGTWRTLIRSYAGNAAEEANAVIRNAILAQVGPDELARRLRRYVVGAEPFQHAFREMSTLTGEALTLDLRDIPFAQRGAARQMVFNSERIAFSELHNARHEAELTHFINDSFIQAIRWRLSPNRGLKAEPDECDYLASFDGYGLGGGVYPLGSAPSPPHPLDRCEMDPITRPTSEISQPKPSPALRRDPRDPSLRFPGMDQLSESAVQRAKESAWRSLARPVIPRPPSV